MLNEIDILSRDYSPLRRSLNKWCFFKEPVDTIPIKVINTDMVKNNVRFAVIYKHNISAIEGYPFPGIQKRI